MWRQLSPYNLVDADNPVFQQEQRRLRWLKPRSVYANTIAESGSSFPR
jgi:hypothetical protein